MNLKKKFTVAGIALTLLMGAQSYTDSSITFAAASTVNTSTQLTQDIQAIQEQQRHDYMYVFQMKNAMMQMTGEGTLSCKADPNFLMMGNMKTQTTGIGQKKKIAMSPIYLQETDNGLVFYSRQEDGSWTKQTSTKPTDVSMLKGNFEQKLCSEILKNKKDATLLKDENGTRVYKVTADGTSLLKNMPMFHVGQTLSGVNGSMVNTVLDNIGDVDIFLGVDYKHHNISVFKADLSKPVQNAFRAAAAKNGLEGLQATALNALTSNMTVVIELSSVDPKLIGDIAIPAEVQEQAVELEAK